MVVKNAQFNWSGGDRIWVVMDDILNRAWVYDDLITALTDPIHSVPTYSFNNYEMNLTGSAPSLVEIKFLAALKTILPGAGVTDWRWWVDQIFKPLTTIHNIIPEIPDIPQIPQIQIPDILPQIPDLTIGINKLIENTRSLINSTLKNILLIIVIIILYQIFKRYLK
jgi:hypothetical protein